MEDLIRQIIEENGGDPDERISELIEEDERSLEQLIDDARESPGQQILREMTLLFTTLEIVNKNFEELQQTRDLYLEKGMELWNVENRDELDAFQREYLRRLHNYSASVHSLERHAYTLLDRYEEEKPEYKEGYFDEIRQRNLGTKVDLIKQLRHYTQKRELPPVAASMHSERKETGEGHEVEFELTLKKDEMMDWDGWDEDVRERLDEMPESIDITELAEEYQAEINDFFEWFRMFTLRLFYQRVRRQMVALVRLEKDRKRRTGQESG